MDKEIVDYIIAYYSGLLEIKEKLVLKHYLATRKSGNLNDEKLKELIIKQWGSQDKEILNLLEVSYEEFKRIAANKILKEHKEKVFINKCPKCGRIARTPFAKQCRFCGYDWH